MKTKMNRAQNAAQRKTFFSQDGQRKLNLAKLKDSNLFGWSVGVIIALFGALGMSFTPVEEDGSYPSPENDSIILNLGDTTRVIGGPRRSHWKEDDGCGGTDYHNKIDYGKVVVAVKDGTGGKVSAIGTNSTSKTTGNNSTAATITWNCGYSDTNDHTDLATKHTNSITFTATPNTGYNFEGWYSDAGCTKLLSSDLSYTEPFKIEHDSWGTDQNSAHETTNTAQTWNRYAKFVEIVPIDITFIAPGDGGQYTVTVDGSSSTVSSSNVVKKGITTAITLSATPASGYIFVGWYQQDGAGNITDLSSNSPYEKKFASNVIVGARFVSTSTPKFKNITTNTEYYGLKAALDASTSGQTIIPVADCTVDGSDLLESETKSYTIPTGVTLLIPYDAANTVEKASPTSVDPAAASNCKPYRTLTLASGVKLYVDGDISVATKQYATATTYTQTGVRTYYGFIFLNEGSEIVLKSGSTLYAWGYISGDGEVTAKSGSTVYEMFQFQDFRGGTRTSKMIKNSQKVFPFQQYYIQNIESKLTLEYGAIEYVRLIVYAGDTQFPNIVKLVGTGTSGALFAMSSGSISKRYDRITDRMNYEVSGTSTLGTISLTFNLLVFSYSVTSSDYVIPLNGNMTLTLKSGGVFNMNQDMSALPGTEIIIEEGATINTVSDKRMYVYDNAEWNGKGCCFDNVDLKQLAHIGWNHKNTYGTPYTRSVTKPAKIVVDGTINMTGTMYTTTSGADICSNGTGKIVFNTKAGTETKTYQDKGNSGYQEIPITPAQLHNKDGFYTKTSDVPANTTVNYKNGHWGWKVTWKDSDGKTLKTEYCYTTPSDSWLTTNKPTNPTKGCKTFSSWSKTTDDAAKQERVYTATYSDNTYAIKYDKGANGTGSIAGGTKTCGVDFTLSSNTFTRTGYTQTGWSTSDGGGKAFGLGGKYTTEATQIFYPYWEVNKYTITWKNSNGTVLETDNNVPYGTTPTYSGTPTKNADAQYTYTFDGWSDGTNTYAVGAALPAVTAATTYTATFSQTENKYTVAVAAGANGAVSPASVSEIGCETASADITATPDAGYAFNGWTLPDGVTAATGYTVASNPIRIHAIAADKTITANFVARNDIKYTVKHYQQNIENDEYTEVTADQETKQGTTATATAATAKSYTGFTAAQPIKQETIAGDGSTVVNIYYNRNTHTITWKNGDDVIKTDENVRFGATPAYNGEIPTKTGYTFAGWSTDESTMPDADLEITASWEPRTDTQYKVEHYWQNIENNDYTLYETISKTGTTAATVTDAKITYDGFDFEKQIPANAIIAADGSLVIKCYYNRETYTVTWKDMDATFTQEQQIVKTEPVVKYGARPDYFNYPKPDRNGMTFDVFGWSNGEMQYKKVGDVLPELPVVTGDVTYTALYNALVEHKQVSEPESLDVDINAATTTIHPGGRLNIADKSLTTTDFVLEATAEESGELIGDVAAENIYFDLFIHDTESRHWHAFTVPFVVNLKKEGKPIQINGETLTLGRGYDIVYYNGAERAARGKSAKCWKYVEDGDSILHPGKAYMIASASRAIDVVRFTKYDDEETHISVSENASSTGVDNDGGWNGIGNPKMYHAVLETGATVCQVHDGGRIGADGYNMYVLTERKLVVGKAVYVQVKADKDDVSVVAATNQEIIQPSPAPRKNKTDRMSGRYDVHIAPADGEMADHIYLLADEEKEDKYVILADLAKAGVSPVRAQMWVDRYDDRLCMNTAVLVNNQADYPLGISVPNAGEYDIYIAAQPEEEAVMYLTLDGKPVWNLSYGGYTATLEKGTTNRYGLRLVKKSSKVPTGMEELTIENGGTVRKVLVNDKVYIIRNGETYTITGQRINQ